MKSNKTKVFVTSNEIDWTGKKVEESASQPKCTKKRSEFEKTKIKVLKIKKAETEIADGIFRKFNFFIDNSKQDGLDYALEWAAYHGKIDYVKKAIEKNANVASSQGAAVQMACANGHLEVLQYLLTIQAVREIQNFQILLEAVENNHVEIVKLLFKWSKENNCNNICDVHYDNDMAIRIAVANGNLDMVQILVENGADVNIFDGIILITAAKHGYLKIINYLSCNSFSKEALTLARNAAHEYGQEQIAQYLDNVL